MVTAVVFYLSDISAVRSGRGRRQEPGGRMFLANHAATRASASASSGNSARGFGPRFREAVTMAGPVRARGCASREVVLMRRELAG